MNTVSVVYAFPLVKGYESSVQTSNIYEKKFLKRTCSTAMRDNLLKVCKKTLLGICLLLRTLDL